jgi:hypothetical protein
MKKFLLNCLLLFMPFLSLVGILNFLYIKTNYWQETIVNEVLKFKDIPEHIQLANVGSSHGIRSFDYNSVPCQSYNFSLSSQYFLYDYLVLKQYINRFNKGAVLFIPISYFQITRIKTDFRDQRARYYHFLAKKYMDFYSIQEKTLFARIPVLTAERDTLKFIIKDIPPIPEFKFMTETELIEYCIEKHKLWTTDSNNVFEAGEEGLTHNKYWVGQIIELCYANNIQPILVTTPITSVLNNIYMEKTPDFFDNFYRFTRELQETYPGLPYFDYSHDPRFEEDFSLFFDGDHLNTIGAKKFTAIVMSDLQASGLFNTRSP